MKVKNLCPCQKNPNGECPYFSLGVDDCALICKVNVNTPSFLEDWLTGSEPEEETQLDIWDLLDEYIEKEMQI